MDSWEFNKIAGAVIGALLIAFGAGTLAEIMHSGHGKTVKAGYELPVTVSTDRPMNRAELVKPIS